MKKHVKNIIVAVLCVAYLVFFYAASRCIGPHTEERPRLLACALGCIAAAIGFYLWPMKGGDK